MLDTKIVIMNRRDNKESSNLLQNSENLSLSDLELPEIEHQRKRKVRRKTRPRLASGRQRIDSAASGHRNIILVGTVFFVTSCWLLILSYTMSVMHIENQRLQSEIKKGLQISLPIKSGTKKIRKRRELDALVTYSIAKRGNINNSVNSKGKHSLEKLLRTSTDEQEDCNLGRNCQKLEKCRVRNYCSIRMFAPLIVVIVVIFLFGFVHWLYFDLRQQLIEYRQKIEEVSVISQNLPEEMQKWHEKSSLLEKNQSLIYEKLSEIQVAVESLKNNFTKYTAQADIRSEYSKDDKFVADLGAKLEAVASDIEVIKDHFTVIQKNHSKLQEYIDKLGIRFSEVSNHIPEKNKNEESCLQKIQIVQANYESDFKGVTTNISVVNDTLTQKVHILSDELFTHKTKLDDLLDKSANITSHVTSIKNDWTKYRQQIVDCEAKYENLQNNMSEIVNKTSNFEKYFQEIRLNCTFNKEGTQNCINTTDSIPQNTNVEKQTDYNKSNV